MVIQWFPGHMAKARREVSEQLKKVDVVFEIVDARIPESSRNPMMEDIIKHKPKVLILNKSDLAERDKTKQWIRHYESQGIIAIEIDSIHSQITSAIEQAAKRATAHIFERNEKKGIHKKTIRALILGIPNVGKSTVINTLAKKGAAKTGNKPGVTKAQQWINVGKSLQLLDTPGILWPKFEREDIGLKLSLTGAIKGDIVHLDEVAIFALNYLIEHKYETLCEHYKIDFDHDGEVIDYFDQIGIKRGMKMKGNEINYELVIETIIRDVRNKKFGPITLEMPNDELSDN